jgi:hypothetical protein
MGIDVASGGRLILLCNFFGGGKSGCHKMFPIQIFEMENRVIT